MIHLKRILAFFAVLSLFVCGLLFFDYILVDDADSYTRLMEHELYNQDDIDILFAGASHCFRSIDPEIIERETGKKAFDACSSNQYPDGSLALIKEAINLYDIEEIYLEISEIVAEEMGIIKDRTEMKATYIISDYMRPSFNKLSYLLNASSPEYYIYSFWRARRQETRLLDFGRIASIIEKKSTDKYRSYSYYYANYGYSDSITYEGKGFVAQKKFMPENGFFSKDGDKPVNVDIISEDWKNMILSIIDLCNKKNIKLTIFAAPVSNFLLTSRGNYDEYIEFVKDFLENKNVSYVDFNLIKNDVFPYKQTYYSDSNHLSGNGAAAFSLLLSDYIKGNITEDDFSISIEEKLASLQPYYYGIRYADNTEEGIRSIYLVDSRKNYFEYKIELGNDNGEASLLQDFDTNAIVQIPLNQSKDKNRLLYVTYREKGSGADGIRVEYLMP